MISVIFFLFQKIILFHDRMISIYLDLAVWLYKFAVRKICIFFSPTLSLSYYLSY